MSIWLMAHGWHMAGIRLEIHLEQIIHNTELLHAYPSHFVCSRYGEVMLIVCSHRAAPYCQDT